MPEKMEGALTGYRVLDLADIKGTYCTKMIADMGAEVIKIENPDGDPTRNIPPFAGDIPHSEKSLYFLYRNANKQGITLNLETSDGRTIFKKLIEGADVLVETYSPGYMKSIGLDYEVLKEINPELIMASITDFGQTGPYKDWKGSDIVAYCMSGAMISSGYPEGSPCRLPGTPAYDSAAMSAAISITLSLFHRGTTGKGQYIDVSVHENARMGLYPWLLPMYSYNVNPGSPPPGPEGRLGTALYPIYPCKDGKVRVVALTPRQWDALVKILGEPEVLMLPEWREFYYRIGNADAIYAIIIGFTMEYTMVELLEAGHREGVPIVPIYDIKGFVDSPHTKAREFFTEIDHPVAGKYQTPCPPYKWTETSCQINEPAPCLGQHNENIYCDELGYSKDDLSALRRAGVI